MLELPQLSQCFTKEILDGSGGDRTMKFGAIFSTKIRLDMYLFTSHTVSSENDQKILFEDQDAYY